MQTEKRFDQAVTLAAAFVANGDIRLYGGDLREDSQAQKKLADLVDTLYHTLEQARQKVARNIRD